MADSTDIVQHIENKDTLVIKWTKDHIKNQECHQILNYKLPVST